MLDLGAMVDASQVLPSECLNRTVGARCRLQCSQHKGYVGHLDFTCGLDGRWHGDVVFQCDDALLLPPVVVGEPSVLQVSPQWSIWDDVYAAFELFF